MHWRDVAASIYEACLMPDLNHGWRTQCIDAGDGTGDFFVELPLELLEEMGLKVGDDLAVDIVSGVLILRPLKSGLSDND
jgi:hypothetical protein